MATGFEDLGAVEVPTQNEDFSDLGAIPVKRVSGRVQLTPGQGVFAGESLGKEAFSMVPVLPNAIPEFQAGMKSGEQLVSPAVLGATLNNLISSIPGARTYAALNLGLPLGAARALATILNPVSKLVGEVPIVTQATGSLLGGDKKAALDTLRGITPVGSAAEIPSLDTGIPAIDIPVNTLSQSLNEAVVKQPISLAGLTPEALAVQGRALRAAPEMASELGRVISENAIGPLSEASMNAARRMASPFRSTTPVDPAAIEAATKRVQDLKSLMEKEQVQREATGGERTARELILQEELIKAQQEAESLGQQALKANQEIGPQLESLVKSSQEALGTAEGFKGRFPTPQEPAAFGKSLNEAIQGVKQEAKVQANEDYSAVKEALPEDQPKLPAQSLESAAAEIAQRKSQGYSAAFHRVLKSVLGESAKIKEADPLSNLSAQARYVYENLPESQRKSFLDQAGIDLLQTKPRLLTWDQLQQRYQDLNRFIEEARSKGNTQDLAAYQQLKAALSEDMSSYAESVGTDVKDLFDEANARFAANKQKLGTSLIERISSDLANEAPESIVDKIVGDKKSSVIENLKQVLSPEKFQEVQSQYAERMFSPSKDVPFDPSHFIKQFDSINNETLKSVFGEEGLAELKKLDSMSKDALKAQELQKTLDDFNSKAQAAEDAYQKAKTSADKKRVFDDIERQAEEAAHAIKDEKYNRDVERAISELKKAQTPQQISLKMRALYGLISFGSFAVVGHPVSGIIAGIGAAALGRIVQKYGSTVGSQLSRALLKNK